MGAVGSARSVEKGKIQMENGTWQVSEDSEVSLVSEGSEVGKVS